MICDTVHLALFSHTSMILLSLSFPFSDIMRYTPVYTYTITYYFQPEKLATLIWYVPVPSAAAFFTH